MEESPQVVKLRASLGAVFYRKDAFDTMMKKQFDRMCGLISHAIFTYLEQLGENAVEEAKLIIESSEPSGKVYAIVDEKGHIIVPPFQASSPGKPPGMITELLRDSIDYKIKSSSRRADYVEIGVWSNELWEYKTIAFWGPSKKRPYGKIVVDTGESEVEGFEHPVSKYAAAMEYGTPTVLPRPFMAPAFNKVVIDKRAAFQKEVKEYFNFLFSKKVPVSFRVYAKRAETPEWEEVEE